MEDFPEFMKSPLNRIGTASQYTPDIEGYVYDGADGSQMAFWTCHSDRVSGEHAHDYDEYLVCVQGRYSVSMLGKVYPLGPGEELFIPRGTSHGGQCVAGTRTIHAFGGKRARRQSQG